MLEDLFNVVKERFNSNSSDTATEPQMFKCPRCQTQFLHEKYESLGKVCAQCNYHGRLSAHERLESVADEGTFTEFDVNMKSLNPIDFPGYEEKQEQLREETGLSDAVVTGTCKITGIKTVIGIMDSRYMMASMGSVVGEKLTRAIEKAEEQNLPLIIFCASGGARMQEGIISLMQMAKTAGAIAKHSAKGLLYISVLTDPTTGGVTASFASLGDIILAEPKVLIGFAGRRVIEGTIKQRLPDTFQSAEFMLEKGFVDMITDRSKMRATLGSLLQMHGYKAEVKS
jgi:acetyl-CoA carboxylase carboxyl transferase subunit beta